LTGKRSNPGCHSREVGNGTLIFADFANLVYPLRQRRTVTGYMDFLLEDHPGLAVAEKTLSMHWVRLRRIEVALRLILKL